MSVTVILNPYANRWGAQARQPAVEAALKAAGVDYKLLVTAGPGDGITLARTAVEQGAEVIVAAGGDGTINEVVNGVLQATAEGPTLPFGILPVGTANDFYQMAGLPLDLTESAKVIAAGRTRLIDAGKVNDRYFINNSAVAMEPMITLESMRITRLSGEARYAAALLKGIAKLKAWQMDIQWDGGGYSGPAYLLSVCNTPRTGGFIMAPGAEMDDGLFDIVFAPQVSKATVINVLFKLTQGKHVEHPDVTFVRTSQLTLTSTPGTPVHADGEVFTKSAAAVAYSILPRKVSLITV